MRQSRQRGAPFDPLALYVDDPLSAMAGTPAMTLSLLRAAFVRAGDPDVELLRERYLRALVFLPITFVLAFAAMLLVLRI